MKRKLALLLTAILCIEPISKTGMVINASPVTNEVFVQEMAENEIYENDWDDFVEESVELIEEYQEENNTEETGYVNRVIVKKSGELDAYGAIEHIWGCNDLHILQYSTMEEAENALEKYLLDEEVIFAQMDKIIKQETEIKQIEESDFAQNEHNSWGASYIGTDQYNDSLIEKYGSESNIPEVVVAVIDTGIDSDHEFLADRIIESDKNYVDGEDTEDVNGHGTHVSGIIKDLTLSNVKIKAYKALDDNGKGNNFGIYLAMLDAIEDGVDVINMSLGGFGEDPMLEEAVEMAKEKGVSVVVAAGNEGRRVEAVSPACIADVITVGGVMDIGDDIYIDGYSNYGVSIDVVAPGTNIYSSIPDGYYGEMTGTSMAAPHVSACAAMLKSYDADLGMKEIESILRNNASDRGIIGWDPTYGAGIVDMSSIEYVDVVEDVEYSDDNGEYEEPFYLELSAKEGQKIYYTTGSKCPDWTYRTLYTEPIYIDHSIQVCAYVEDESGRISNVTRKIFYFNGEDYEGAYEINYEGKILGYSGARTEIVIPEIVEGIEVKGIASEAFAGSIINKVTIPGCAETIEVNAFMNAGSLREVVLQEGVKKIAITAFSFCTNLEKITIPDSLEYIGSSAFQCAPIKELYLGKNMKTLGETCFLNMDSLEKVTVHKDNSFFTVVDNVLYTKDKKILIEYFICNNSENIVIPDYVEVINDKAFYNYRNKSFDVNELKIGKNVKDIGDLFSDFYGKKISLHEDNNYYCTDSAGFYNKDKTVLYRAFDNETDYYEVCDSVKVIEDFAFRNVYCTEIKFSSNLQRINAVAINSEFSGDELHIPDSVEFIEGGVAIFAENLKSIYFEGDLPSNLKIDISSIASSDCTIYYYKGAKGFENVKNYYNVVELDESDHESDVVYYETENGEIAFQKRTGTILNYTGYDNILNVPRTIAGVEVKSIAPYAFYETGIVEIYMPDSVINVGHSAFLLNNNLIKVKVSGNIEEYAFYGCENLSEVVFGKNTYEIEDSAFSSCYKINKINLPDTLEIIGDSAFYANTFNDVIIPENVKKIGVAAFLNHYLTPINLVFLGDAVELPLMGYIAQDGLDNMVDGYKYYYKKNAAGFDGAEWVAPYDTIEYEDLYYLKDSDVPVILINGDNGSVDFDNNKTFTITVDNGYRIKDVLVNGESIGVVEKYTFGTISELSTLEVKYILDIDELDTSVINKLENTKDGINVSWSPVKNAQGYYLYRKNSGEEYVKIATISGLNNTSYLDDSVKASGGKEYTYAVVAYFEHIESEMSTGKNIVRLIKPALPALNNVTKGIQIKWSKVTGAKGYEIYRKASSGSWKKIKSITKASTLTYTDTTVKPGTKYYYSIMAVSGTSKSVYDTNGKAITRIAEAKVPTLSNVTKGVQVKWSKVTGVTGYQVYRKTAKTGWKKIKTISKASTVTYVDTTAKNGTTYQYSIRAVKGSTLASYNTTGKKIVRLTAPTVSGIKNSSAKAMKLTWKKNSSATGYQVMYATNSKFTKSKTKTYSGASSVTKTITKLTKGKTYYVKVRSYKKAGSTTYYSEWSTVKKIKITK